MKESKILNHNNLFDSIVDDGSLQILNGVGKPSRIPIISYLDNYCIRYLGYSREVKFLCKGIYEVCFELLLSATNECDKISVNFGEKEVYEFNIPIRKKTKVIEKFTINVEDIDKKLSITNVSDDKLILEFYKGGYDMDSSSMTITRTNEPISITNIKDINNKTVTVVLNQSFMEIDVIEVCKKSDGTEVDSYYVQDSVNPLDNERVVVVENDEDKFETGETYILKVIRDEEIVKMEFNVEKTAPPVNTSVDVVGDRIINIKFDKPIKNLDAISEQNEGGTIPEEDLDILMNFYTLYYNQDINGELDESVNKWYGITKASKSDTTKEAIIRVAKDYKSIEIQYNHVSLPLGNHGFIVGFSKIQTVLGIDNKPLMDFSEDSNIFPTTKKIINIEKENIVSTPINVEAVDRKTLIVTFDKPVIILDNEKDVIKVNGSDITVSKVSRIGNEFNILKYELQDPLFVGTVDITVGRITDANGYKTPETIFEDVPVVIVVPRIVDVDQYEDNQDEIIVKFSKAMKDSDEEGGVRNVSYYSVSKLNGMLVTPIQAYNYDSTEYTVILKFADKLEAGSHTLYAANIEDEYGTPMEAQSEMFNIIDTTKPTVESITFREQAIVVKFDDKMKTSGEHSITESTNYRLEQDESGTLVKKSFPAGTAFLTMNEDKWLRITVPSDILAALTPIDIGYQALREIKYVTNDSDNILNVCTEREISELLIEAIDISNTSFGTLTVVDDKTLIYQYSGNNELYSVNKVDFSVTLDGEIKNIIDVKFSYKTIEFDFAPKTFDGASTDIKIKTADIINSTKDIFGYKIEADKEYAGTVVNGMKAKITAVSLINSNTLRVVFNKEIAIFKYGDFRCMNGNISILSTEGVPYGTTKTVFDLTIASNVAVADDLSLALAVPEDMIQTQDIDGNKMEAFGSIEVIKFYATTVAWLRGNSEDNSIKGSQVIVQFNKPINPQTLIPTWDGSDDITIAPSDIEFNPTGEAPDETAPTLMTLNIAGNAYGNIQLDDIVNTTVNSANATLSLSDDKKAVTILFSVAENASVAIQVVDKVVYNPTSDLSDASNTAYLYEDAKPEATITNV